MKREIIKIDEDKCNGCGLCIPNCHEGALQIIDGKARLISDLMCDGLGACIGHCPEGAMEIELREAQAYDEIQVIKDMIQKGRNVVTAHLKHLKEHGEFVFLKQAAGYLSENEKEINFPVKEVLQEVHASLPGKGHLMNGAPDKAAVNAGDRHVSAVKVAPSAHQGGGCPGSRSMSFIAPVSANSTANAGTGDSQLTQWPVQMHLINPQAAHFNGSDLLLAADCVAYSVGDFHNRFLKGKTLAIACPKLDSNKEIYLEKLITLIAQAKINTLTVIKMEVPCCSGIEQLAIKAVALAGRKVPVKSITIGIKGEVIDEEWL